MQRILGSLRRSAVGAGDLVLTAVSGGPDSSALLLLLCSAADTLGVRCEAAYFDHQIRDEAERAAEFQTVQRLCARAGVLLHAGTSPVPTLAKAHHRSPEDEARVARYRFLAQVAAVRGAGFVATGHTADDQVETILLHLLRGSGLRGLTGMRECGAWPFGSGPQLLRPLLSLNRAETLACTRARGITPHEDSENRSPQHTRNRVRSELLPMLESFNPQIRSALLRLSVAAAQQVELLDAFTPAGGRAAEDGMGPDGQGPLDARWLRQLSAAARAEVLAKGFAAAAGGRAGLTARHLTALDGLLTAGGERAVDLPAGLRARRRGVAVSFERRSAHPMEPPIAAADMLVPGEQLAGGWAFHTELVQPGVGLMPDLLHAVLRASDAAAGLRLRARRPGDRVRLDAGRGHKKVQDVLVDAKVPRSERDSLPLCCCGDEVVWVPGVFADARARVRDGSVARVSITATRLDGASPDWLGSVQPTE